MVTVVWAGRKGVCHCHLRALASVIEAAELNHVPVPVYTEEGKQFCIFSFNDSFIKTSFTCLTIHPFTVVLVYSKRCAVITTKSFRAFQGFLRPFS